MQVLADHLILMPFHAANLYEEIVLLPILSEHTESHEGIYSQHVNKLEIRTYDFVVIS